MEAALAEYTETRNKDAETICDLAMYNYVEVGKCVVVCLVSFVCLCVCLFVICAFGQMRSHVTSPWFLMKKKIDNFLHWLMPRTFIPLYSMVSCRLFYFRETETNCGKLSVLLTHR